MNVPNYILDPKDSEYLMELYIKYEKLIKYTIAKSISYMSKEDMEDCLMDVFCISCCKIEQLKSSPNPAGWLVKTAKLVSKNRMRRNITIDKYCCQNNEDYIYVEEDFEDQLIENIIFESWLKDNVSYKIYSLLNKTDKELYDLKLRRKLTVEEIAKRKNKSIGSIRVAVSRMEHRIKQIIIKKEFKKIK